MTTPTPTITITKDQLIDLIVDLHKSWTAAPAHEWPANSFSDYVLEHVSLPPGTKPAPESTTPTGSQSVPSEFVKLLEPLEESMVLLATVLKNDKGIPDGSLLQVDKHLSAMEKQMNLIRSLPIIDSDDPTDAIDQLDSELSANVSPRQKIFGIDITNQVPIQISFDRYRDLEEIDVRIKVKDGKLTVTA